MVQRYGVGARPIKKTDCSSPLRLSFLLSKVVVYGHCLIMTLPVTVNETIKWLTAWHISKCIRKRNSVEKKNSRERGTTQKKGK